MKEMRKLVTVSLAALALTFATPTLQGGDHAKQKGAELLETIESNAIDVRSQAARMKSYLRNPQQHSWLIHSDELTRMKTGMERVAELLGDLKPLRDDLSVAQRTAFNRVVTESAELTTQVERAMSTLNDDRAKIAVGHPDYEEHIDKIYNLADEIVVAADSAEEWRDFLQSWQSTDD